MPKYHLTRTAVLVILEKDEKIFFLRRKNTGLNDGELTLPSGHVDKGESVLHAGVREAKEEAGVAVKEKDLVFIHAHYCRDIYTNFYFRATQWEDTSVLNEPDLASEGVWISKDGIPNDVIFQVRHMLEEVKKGNYFSDIDIEDNLGI